MTSRAVLWINLMKPQAFYGTPSFALHLAEVARKEGVDPKGFGIKRLFFSGEPGASVPGVKDRIEQAYQGKVYDSGSMAEITPWMNVAGTEQTSGMLCWQDLVYTEVCDPANFHRVPYGQRGTPVYTQLERTSQPMIRLVSGDLTQWTNEPNPCGRTYPRLPNGIFGRIDDMFTIRGENVYPSEIDAALNQVEGYGGEHRIIISRSGARMDELLLRVEPTPEVEKEGKLAAFQDRVMKRIHTMLGLRAGVEVVPCGTFPRTDFKARRVIDDREVVGELDERMSKDLPR